MSTDIQKYLEKRSIKNLSPEEQLLEINKVRSKVNVDIFQEDIELAKRNRINVSRLIRYLFHDWLIETELNLLNNIVFCLECGVEIDKVLVPPDIATDKEKRYLWHLEHDYCADCRIRHFDKEQLKRVDSSQYKQMDSFLRKKR